MTDKPFFKQRDNLPEYPAGDECLLRELLHPARDPVKLDYSIAYARVEPHGRTLDHFLHQSEVYYVIKGEGIMYLDHQPYRVETGHCYYIPPRCRQWLQNTADTDFEFLCIVNPPWSAEQEEVVE
ncbi:MAG: cupin domain-containing protein [Anaerolineae bacterium]|jgi:mannose-6-phosphate isomerase-like protein (cupin superfamily)|nr:cupin domain-containing protein [Anaerolineae bacterium]